MYVIRSMCLMHLAESYICYRSIYTVFTKAVVAICVVFVPAVAGGAVGTPVILNLLNLPISLIFGHLLLNLFNFIFVPACTVKSSCLMV